MTKDKALLITAKYGSLEFQKAARPYNENSHDEQVETCVESIRQQIADAGRAEMTVAFHFSERLISEG